MKTLRVLTVSMLVAATASWAGASEDSSIPTITVTAKRYPTGLTVEHVPPQSAIEIAAFLTGDMPEAEIDRRLTPIGAAPAPTDERAIL